MSEPKFKVGDHVAWRIKGQGEYLFGYVIMIQDSLIEGIVYQIRLPGYFKYNDGFATVTEKNLTKVENSIILVTPQQQHQTKTEEADED